jgi:hypothetical protein
VAAGTKDGRDGHRLNDIRRLSHLVQFVKKLQKMPGVEGLGNVIREELRLLNFDLG